LFIQTWILDLLNTRRISCQHH